VLTAFDLAGTYPSMRPAAATKSQGVDAAHAPLLTLHRTALAGSASAADTACIDTPLEAQEPTMNISFRTAPRFAAFAFAAVMTLATLMGVGGLAEHSSADVQLAVATATEATA
jgi:hypothetical protein